MTGYEILTPASTRGAYATLTDKLVYRIEQHLAAAPPHLLFLDKSARPVAWFVRSFWRLFARRPGTAYADGIVPPMPSMSFANIDREQWWAKTGASETGVIDVGLVPADDVAGLRAAYLRRRPLPGSSLWDQPAFLDGRSVLVIDEVSNTGDTLTIATGLVARAFPTATVTGLHWMTPGTVVDQRSGQRRTASVPVWYRGDTPRGRLIGNRLDPTHRGTSWRGRLGGLFLSTVPSQPDALGIQLRREVAGVAADVAAGRQLAALARRDDADDRMAQLYGYDDPVAFTRDRLAQADNP